MDQKDKNEAWERKFIEKLAAEALGEQRRRRRWGIFFKLVTLVYVAVIGIVMLGFQAPKADMVEHVALIDIQGVIAAGTPASAERVNQGLRNAMSNDLAKGVILRINSPGGSPVQAGLINDEMVRLRAKYPNKPIYTVVEDVCASGGYYIAAASDAIFVDKASLVGSIGVLINGFGFTGVMEKLGVERRLITAGENKGFLDPFTQADPYQQEYAKQMIGQIHQQFIDVVKAGRGDKLSQSPDLFSGLVWNGAESIQLGLADELGSVGSVTRDKFATDQVMDYSIQDPWLERLADQVGVSLGKGVAQVLGFTSLSPLQ